jgi:8-oxo-dGTP diphosphatase
MPVKRKVLTYITQGNRLLVFTHPFAPEAGIQVPGGSLHDDETPEAGALREAREETGLNDLRVEAFLGETLTVFEQQAYHRHFYHLCCEETTPERWRHGEYDASDGSAPYIPFDFYWVPLPDGIPPLAGDMDALLPELLRRLTVS